MLASFVAATTWLQTENAHVLAADAAAVTHVEERLVDFENKVK